MPCMIVYVTNKQEPWTLKVAQPGIPDTIPAIHISVLKPDV